MNSLELFNPLDPEFIADPYPYYRRVRDADHVYFHDVMDAHLVTRFDDVQAMLRDPGLGAVKERFFGNCPPGSDIDRVSESWLFFLDPPDHPRVRRLFTSTFAPRRVESMRETIRAVLDRRLDVLEREGGGDFIGTVAQDLPVAVICSMMGIPDMDLADCTRHSSAMVKLLDPLIDADQLAAAEQGAAWALDYFGALVKERRANPADDLISALVQVNDREPERLTDTELLNNIVFMFGAGHETATGMLGNGLHALLTHPGQWEALCADPEGRAPAVVAEVLRWDPPVQYFSRKVLREVEIGGRTIPEGASVMGLIGAANRDPAKFPDPDAFDVSRENVQSLSFGGGTHFCIGAMLARTEAEISFRALAERFPGIRPAAEPRRRKMLAIRGYEEFQVEIGGIR
ncbi:cytochrome P450 [Actinocorallia sp. B10E7]|uniref:cytochrome P450 n=1 Tax=Actinocorallia sp. B10E7 TaxID=3153558 RepID=UPI00325D31AD